MKVNVVWESYDSYGRKRARPPASTIHGWLTKMRGTLLDNETTRRRGIREMREAREKRTAIKEQNAALARAGKPPVRPKVRQPWLRLSFLRNRPKPVAGPASPGAGFVTQYYYEPWSHIEPKSKSSSKKPSRSRQKSRSRKRSTAHKRLAGSSKKVGRK